MCLVGMRGTGTCACAVLEQMMQMSSAYKDRTDDVGRHYVIYCSHVNIPGVPVGKLLVKSTFLS